MKFIIFQIILFMSIQVSLAADASELSTKDSIVLSAKLLDENKFDQSLSISLPIYEQRKRNYFIAGILSMRAYFSNHNSKDAVIIGDDIKDIVQQVLVAGNESHSDWDAEMTDYFYWSFVNSYASALYKSKRYRDAIPYFHNLIPHGEKVGGDNFIYFYSLADSCMEVGDFHCALKFNIQLLKAVKKTEKYAEHEKVVYYNLACAEAALGEYNKANDYLLSTEWKWEKLEKLIAEDKDLKGFRDSEYFEQLRMRIVNNEYGTSNPAFKRDALKRAP